MKVAGSTVGLVASFLNGPLLFLACALLGVSRIDTLLRNFSVSISTQEFS